MGENDKYCETLEDGTIVKEPGQHRRCVCCNKIRIGNAAGCLYCLQKSRERAGMLFIFILFIVLLAFTAAAIVNLEGEDVPPPRYLLPDNLSENLDTLIENTQDR